MHLRCVMVGLLAVLEICLLSGMATSETSMPDYDAYVVGQNETLSSIATDYGLSAGYLAQFNKMLTTDSLQIGQVIVIPKVAQLPKSVSEDVIPANVPTPAVAQVQGVLATVTAASTAIWSKPGGGVSIFAKTTQGTELLVTGTSGSYYAVLMADGSTGWVLKAGITLGEKHVTVDKPIPPTTQTALSTTAESLGANSTIVQTALAYLGVPYKYGGRLPGTLDCSLFVQTVFARNGIKLPRTAAQQALVGVPVDVSALQPGDRLYFRDRSGNIRHTAIYIGDGRFIHASTNRGAVAVDALANPTYWRKFAGARR